MKIQLVLPVCSLFLALAGPPAAAQVTFSIDLGGPTTRLPLGLSAADVLLPAAGVPTLGPLVPPFPVVPPGPGGLGIAVLPAEVDGLSYGLDGPALPGGPPARFWFSVDEFANGIPGAPLPPALWTEGAPFGAPAGGLDAGADVFVEPFPMPPGPLMPFMGPAAHVGALDGNGWRSSVSNFGYPGLGMLEFNPPGPPPDLGDNLDALDVDGPIGVMGFFYSLDSRFVDPMTGLPNSGSALANGYVGGDVIRSFPPGTPPVVYAPAPLLGLDLLAGPDTDDLDALAVFENGLLGYQPSMTPYDWLGGASDMLFFSVRRGSAVVGAPDCFFGIPIEPGDILVPPFPGGLSPFPGIFIAAENLGLATVRSGFPWPFGDDMDALDVIQPGLVVLDCNGNGQEDVIDIVTGFDGDCNGNGVPDRCDIAFGASCDSNGDSVPDECQFSGVTPYCVAKVNSQGCTPLIWALGTPSATCNQRYDITAVNMVSNKATILLYGFAPAATPFYGGILCIGPPVRRTPATNSGGVWPPNNCTGASTFDFNSRIQSGIDPALVQGATVYTQFWGRDKAASFAVSLSDALRFTIAP